MINKSEKLTPIETTNARRYSEIAPDYGGDWRGQLDEEQRTEMDHFLELVGAPPAVIADIGCGTGKAANYFVDQGYQVVGLDLSAGMLGQAVAMSGQEHGELMPVRANMRQLPLADDSVSSIWNAASIVHVPKDLRPEVISEFYRILKPEGFLNLSVQNLLSKKHLQRVLQSYMYILGYDQDNQFYMHSKSITDILAGPFLVNRLQNGYAYLDDRHWFFPTQHELINLMTKVGFKIVQTNSRLAKRVNILAVK